MDNLDKCPFCGGKAEFVKFSDLVVKDDGVHSRYYDVFIQCVECQVRTSGYTVDDEDEELLSSTLDHLRSIWNRRLNTPQSIIKHHWIINSDGCSCSNCGSRIPTGILSQVDFHFCPSCGARM